MKNIDDAKKIEVLAAYNDYIAREFGDSPCTSIEDAFYDGNLLGIAYTQYEDDEPPEYYAIQVSYDIDKECYKTFLDYVYKETVCIEEPATIEQFITDLKYGRFENFICISQVIVVRITELNSDERKQLKEELYFCDEEYLPEMSEQQKE